MKALKRSLSIITAAALMLTTAVPAFAADAPAPADDADLAVPSAAAMVEVGEYADDQIIVVFDDGVKDSKIENTIESEDASCVEIAETASDTKVAVAEIDSNTSVEEAIETLTENDNVLYAQPNYRYEIMADNGTNDPYNNDDGMNQWYLTNIKAREAWAAMKDVELNPVKVAVIDSGVHKKHEDLQGIISEDSVRILGAEVKSLEGDSSSEGHGTHVCGIIGATSDNEIGITGVATGVSNDYLEIIAIDATSQDYAGEYFDTYGIVSAIEYAVEKGAQVINMSLGGPGVDLVLEDAVEMAYESGVTVVVAAGNEGTDEVVTPSDHNEVISVCNTTREDKRYEYEDWWYGSVSSNFGQPKDISAPGTSVLSTVPRGYENFTGTSMSTPMVSAVAAMVYAVNPDLTPAQVRNILCGTARDVDAAGYDYYTGYGVVNAVEAVNAAMTADASDTVEKIEFKEGSDYVFRLGVKERGMLEILITPANSLADVTWTSSDESVAIVDSKGKVKGVSAGTATITCTAGNVNASCAVEIQSLNEPQSLTVTNADKAAEMAIDDSFYLETEVLPRFADKKKIFWKSSDLSVVTVDELGCVTARGLGEAKIMGYLYNSKYTDFDSLPEGGDPLTVVIDVKVLESVKKVEFVNAPAKVRLKSAPQYTAKVTPEGAGNAQIYWKTSNRAVAGIDQETGVLKPVSTGKVTVTAYTANGKSANKRILVYTTIQTNKYGFAAKVTDYNSAKLTWNAIENADGYIIYRNGKAIKTLSADTCSFVNTKLTCGKTYKYKVRAFYKVGDEKDLCTVSAERTVKPVPLTPKVKAKSADGKITVSWTKVNGATKYEVYKYNKTQKKYVRVAKKSTVSFVDKKVKKGCKYTYKVKAYRVVNGKKVYGSFSKTVSAVAK